MRKRLPRHLSHKSALVLLPPQSIAPPIEETRKVHDRHYARWPPHINLIYPFLSAPSELIQQGDGTVRHLKEEIRVRIERATRPFRTFQESLAVDNVGVFHHDARKKTVWLKPTTHRMHGLQAALQAEFLECNTDSRPFTPHLSIGQARTDGQASRIGDDFRNNVTSLLQETPIAPVKALDWTVDRVFVIERENYQGCFSVIGEILLQTA
ncbi:hypothetical protein ACN47E_006179 [Coniothyrium glycines]